MDTELDYSDADIRSKFEDICQTISTNKNIERVYLSGCELVDKHAEMLSDILPKSTVRELYLSRNNITQKGVEALCNCVPTTRLVVLQLDRSIPRSLSDQLDALLSLNSENQAVPAAEERQFVKSAVDPFCSSQQSLRLLDEQRALAKKLGVDLPHC
eukprot:TRINITY_DN654_c0_g1_i3.p1 TRINITY_DN654_c0_g1~~TRINITY_DN654_c0_g1_i3.p1  ORF type:complete len:168 (+),score=33.03 TRINITY_DN654_c0_g1_i3:35-505(+)